MKKVLFTIFFSFLILFCNNNVYAKTEFSVSSTSGKLNDKIKVNVNMSDGHKFMMLGIKIRYDKNLLEFESCKINGFKSAYMKGCKEGTKGLTFYAISSSDDLINNNDNIFIVYFKVKKKFTNTSINLDVTDYSKSLDDDIDYDTKSGVITFIDDDNDKKDSNNNNTYNYEESNSKSVNKDDIAIKNNKEENKSVISNNKKSRKGSKTNFDKNILFVIILVVILLTLFIIFKKKYSKMK